MKHRQSTPIIVQTRLAVPVGENKSFLRGEWVLRRLELLERITAVSIRSQTRKVDEWQVFYSAALTKSLRSDIQSRLKRVGARPIEVEAQTEEDCRTELSRPLSRFESGEVISLRLDADDYLAKTACETVANQLTSPGWLSLSLGLQLASRAFYVWPYVGSNFLARREDLQCDPKGVYEISHSDVWTQEQVKAFFTRPMWLVVSHDQNTSTHGPRGVRIPRYLARAEFRDLAKDHLLTMGEPPNFFSDVPRSVGELATRALRPDSRARIMDAVASMRFWGSP